MFDAVIRKYMPYPVSYQYVPYDNSSESYDNLVSQVPEQVSTHQAGQMVDTSHACRVCICADREALSVRTDGDCS